MKPHIIQCLLKERGLDQSDVAKILNVSGASVSGVILGKAASEKIERAISKALQLPVQSVFPRRYDAEGRSQRPRRRLSATYNPSNSVAALAEAVAKIQAAGVAA